MLRFARETFVVAAILLLVPVALSAAKPPVPNSKSPKPTVRFESDVLKAYRKAIREKKPLVICYYCPRDRNKCTFCRKMRQSFRSAAFSEFANKVVFVEVELDGKLKSADKSAETIFRKLKLKDRPAVIMLDSDPKVLRSLMQLTGYFDTAKLYYYVRRAIEKRAARTSESG